MIKRLCLFLLFLPTLTFAQFTTTPNIGLEIPANGSNNWNIPLNYNFNLIDALIGGTQQNPGVGLSLKPLFGTGSPGVPCNANNQGQQYFDTSQTPFIGYICDAAAWHLGGASGGGSFPTNAFVYGLSATTSRAGTPADFATLLSILPGCTTTGQPYSPADGQCITSSGSFPPAGIPKSTGTGYGTSYSTTGSGTVVALQNSPSFITPSLGVAGATSINNALIDYDTTNSNTFVGFDIVPPTGGAQFDASFGDGALAHDQSSGSNTAVGAGALNVNSTGFGNTAIGQGALLANTSGSLNDAFGDFTLGDNTTGGNNVGNGQQSLANNTTGNNNTAVGDIALFYNTIGSNNTAIGEGAGAQTSTFTNLNNSVFIGKGADAQSNNLTDMIVLGYLASGTASHQMTLGGSTITTAIIMGAVTVPNLAGSGSRCLHVSSTGLISPTSSDCGSGGGGGNTTSTSLTSTTIPVANGANSIVNSLLTDNGTTLTYTGSGGFAVTATTPGAISVVPGAGSIPALIAFSGGFAAPNSGGTAYLIKLPATMSAGIAHFAAPATNDGVNESVLTSSLLNLATETTGNLGVSHLNGGTSASSTTFWRGDGIWSSISGSATYALTALSDNMGNFGTGTPVTTIVAPTNGHFSSLSTVNIGGTGCTTGPTINVFDGVTNVGTPVTASSSAQLKGNATTQSETLAVTAGDVIGIYVSANGTSCATQIFTVSAQVGP